MYFQGEDWAALCSAKCLIMFAVEREKADILLKAVAP